ncbi:hypothetical protein [Streptomyces sp. 8N616]|uniref:hypothetical protein n=1 Tax=Streptomyces sp. 8N616 TaxID=3457414 RepID=UPI003FCF366A
MSLREWWGRLGMRLMPLKNPAQAVYGTVITGAVMAAYSEPPVEIDEVVPGVLATVVVYWLAHVYAEELVHFEEGVAFSRRRLWSTMRAQWAIVRAALAPVLVLLVALLFGATPTVALEIAVWFTVLLLVGFGTVSALRGGLRGGPLILAALLAGSLGLILVALKGSVD